MKKPKPCKLCRSCFLHFSRVLMVMVMYLYSAFSMWIYSNVRWPTTVTSKPNAHSKLQSAHIKFKSLTSNSNRSQQIQITHSKFKSLTANSNHSQQITNHSQQITNRSQQIQIAHSKFKSPTANSNRPQQIKVAHSKFKLLTANYKSLIPLGAFGYLQPAVQLV